MQNRDITQLIRGNGLKLPNNKILATIGKAIKKEYILRYPNKIPQKTTKHVNGAIREVNVYPPADEAWILAVIEKYSK
jgi:hypothetical protein